MDDTATPRPRLEREMVREALEGLAELVVRGVRASADPGEAAGKAGAGLRALGGWVERLAGEGSEAVSEGRKPMQLRAELPVERGLMSVGIPSAVGVLDPGDFPEAFVVVRETEEEVLLAEGDSFLMVDGPWGPVVVPEEVAVRVEVAGEGVVREEPVAEEKLEVAEEPVVACEVKVELVVPVAVEKEDCVPEEVPVVAEPEVVVPVGVLEPEVKSEPEEERVVEEKTPEVVLPVAVLGPEVEVTVREEPVVAVLSEVSVPPVVVEREVKVSEPPATVVSAGPVEARREFVGWRMPEPVAVAPSSRGPGVVMRVMVLVLLVLVGWLVYKVLVPRGY